MLIITAAYVAARHRRIKAHVVSTKQRHQFNGLSGGSTCKPAARLLLDPLLINVLIMFWLLDSSYCQLSVRKWLKLQPSQYFRVQGHIVRKEPQMFSLQMTKLFTDSWAGNYLWSFVLSWQNVTLAKSLSRQIISFLITFLQSQPFRI